MISVEPFSANHLCSLQPHAGFPEFVPLEYLGSLASALEIGGHAFTIRDRNGYIVFCGGAIIAHDEHVTLSCVMNAIRGRLLAEVTRATRDFIAKRSERRVDTIVRANFKAGHDWVKRLGFVREAELGQFFRNGDDAVIYRLERTSNG